MFMAYLENSTRRNFSNLKRRVGLMAKVEFLKKLRKDRATLRACLVLEEEVEDAKQGIFIALPLIPWGLIKVGLVNKYRPRAQALKFWF